MPVDPATVDFADAHATMGEITLDPGQNLVLEVRIGDVFYYMTYDTGAARSVARASTVQALRDSGYSRDACLERYSAANPKRCSGAAEGGATLTVATVQLLTMRLSGFKTEAFLDTEGIAHYRVLPQPAEATLCNVPFGEISNLADGLRPQSSKAFWW